ncbi:hypothetical protein HX847_05380 [Marine Group I thaumarchaeote]|uniref:Uncharacterized protein n=1 Tax=Marine Group I thaumarchaeote TaxID=2511932 RepID=A0A7K4P4G8_9ARCH|nr:MAG: hypothetical protein DSN69_03940 [Nitrosopumilus sp. YT1]NMI82245.1 hypothetical protein [Candidatus Nitrosopumilus sp. MTA1]NWJ84104.1 hypothetical protein [Marine Group I thaumarchaeote]NWK07826.1 hypothetical protein [Marine Group I thaumarchaeote]NWK13573.1 hypothetical protein [Marine Group I thaumarchaeote]
MTDSLLDDVNALLDKDIGDDKILKQIWRACENNEVISNYERNYVRKLAEKHLGRRPKVVQTKILADEKPTDPDVIIPETPSVQKIQTFQPPARIISSNLKNSKLMLGIGGVALVIIIAVAASFNGLSDVTPTNSIPDTLSIQTDLSSYDKKDIISISGMSDTSGIVNLSIENKNNELVWAEQVSLKNDGRYSTLAIAGGPGWESSGTYTINIDNGVETRSISFSFTT